MTTVGHVGFCTTLQTEHIDAQYWRLTSPLVWRGQWQYIVIAPGFETDFTSIPKLLRLAAGQRRTQLRGRRPPRRRMA